MLNDGWDTRDGVKAPDMTIPILMRNKVPEGFETDDKLDVSIRPESVSFFIVISLCNAYNLYHNIWIPEYKP